MNPQIFDLRDGIWAITNVSRRRGHIPKIHQLIVPQLYDRYHYNSNRSSSKKHNRLAFSTRFKTHNYHPKFGFL